MAAPQTPPGRTVGRSVTKKRSPGRVLALENPVDRGYLCEKMCACSQRTAIISKSGAFLKQRCATARIWADEEVNQLVWRYKAEVGFSMATNPPSPLMSKDQPNRPSRFPLGRAMGDGLLKRTLEGKPQKGLLRIPDCIILKLTGPELAAMRASRTIDWKRLIPVKANIETVLEMKFDGDRLKVQQQKAYVRIAGPDKFRLLKASACDCGSGDNRRDPETAPERSPVITPILPPLGGGRRPPLIGRAPTPVPAPRPVRPQYGPEAQPGEGTPLSEHLKDAAIVAGIVVVGILAAELIPIGVVGAVVVRLVVLGAGAARSAHAAPAQQAAKANP